MFFFYMGKSFIIAQACSALECFLTLGLNMSISKECGVKPSNLVDSNLKE